MSDEEQIRRVLAQSMHYADDRNARGQVGRYLDRFVRSGHTWLFSGNRIVTI